MRATPRQEQERCPPPPGPLARSVARGTTVTVTVRTVRRTSTPTPRPPPPCTPANLHRTGQTTGGNISSQEVDNLHFRSHQRKITLTSRDDFPAHNTLRQEPAQLLHMNLNCKLEMFYNQKHQPAYSQAQEAVTSTGKEGRRDPWSDCLNLIPDFPADTFSDMSTSEPEDFLCDLSLNSSLESLPLETFNFFNEKQNIAY